MNFSNSSMNSTDMARFPPSSKILVLNAVITVIAFIGNTLVLAILRNKKAVKHRPPFEFFIANLSIADLTAPLAYILSSFVETPSSTIYCKVMYPLSSILQVVSMYTIVAIAIFRCKAIISPLHFKPGKKSIYGTIAVIWLLSHVLFIPVYIVEVYDKGTGFCQENWPSKMMNKVYTVALFVAQFLISLAILTICYTKIILYLKHHRIPQENNLKMARKRKQDKEVIKISGVIVLLYVVLTLPCHISWILIIFEVLPINNIVAYNFLLIGGQITLVQCCCNPIVYGVVSKQFRADVIAYFRSCFRKC